MNTTSATVDTVRLLADTELLLAGRARPAGLVVASQAMLAANAARHADGLVYGAPGRGRSFSATVVGTRIREAVDAAD